MLFVSCYFSSFNSILATLNPFPPIPFSPGDDCGLNNTAQPAKIKSTYSRRSSSGGYTTLFLLFLSFLLSCTELRRWYRGRETHVFNVEKGVSHDMQINIDIVLPMSCADLHINVQDASGDRILAGDLLKRDNTNWAQWVDVKGSLHSFDNLGEMEAELEKDTHAGHVLGEVKGQKKKFRKTPRLRRGDAGGSCRVYGSIEGNKVQGDFHLTARGHGYWEFGEHLDHSGMPNFNCLVPPFNLYTNLNCPAFNFSHIVNELSFGPHYPTLLNPLDSTISTTPHHFYKYQYYLSIVPTIYTRTPTPPPTASTSASFFSPFNFFPFSLFVFSSKASPELRTNLPPGSSASNTILTNQYAATSHSNQINERDVPGIFFKYDIEPILVTVREERDSVLRALVRVVNVVSGVLVGGGWVYSLMGWGRDVVGAKKNGGKGSMGVLHGGEAEGEEEE